MITAISFNPSLVMSKKEFIKGNTSILALILQAKQDIRIIREEIANTRKYMQELLKDEK